MSNTCDTCGKSLDHAGDCPACLIQLGISQGAAESNLDQHLAALPPISELNQYFPQLQITRLVGRGGMGAIYHARQTALDRDVALKIIAKEIAGDTAFIDRFEREAKTLARLSHPNIVTVFDFGQTEDRQAYLIMEFVDGINLREAIKSGSVDRHDALQLISTICHALQYAHNKGVVHRDIKPENILLGEDGSLKVADFGIAKIVDKSVATPTLTATQQVLGSLHYLAPEHLESPSQIDHRVDIYALGVIFYELLTGQMPLGRYEPPSSLAADIDPRLDAIVMKALSRQPGQRYQSAAELDVDLQQIIGSQSYSAQPRPRTHADQIQTAAVPFSYEAFPGLVACVGMLRATPGELTIEHRLQDSIFGAAKSNANVISIPTSDITSFDLIPGFRNSKLVLMTNSISALDGMPGAGSGRVELKIKRSDAGRADDLLAALGYSSGGQHLSLATPRKAAEHSVKSHSGWATFGVFMLFCGTVNAGLLAIGNVFFAEELRDIAMIASMVGIGILIGPICLIQLCTGLICMVARPVGLARAASIVSMIPTTPGWLLSFPVGFWAYRWLRQTTADQSGGFAADRAAAPEASRSMFWSTTSLFIPESRWGRRLLAIGNAALATLVIGGFATFKLGLYPTTMTYRVVDSTTAGDDILGQVAQRIHSHGTVQRTHQHWMARGSSYSTRDGDRSPRAARNDELSRFDISVMARDRDTVRQLLAIEGNVQLAWLARQDDADANQALDDDRQFAVATGLTMPTEVARRQVNFGTQVRSLAAPMVIESNQVANVTAGKSTLTLALSRKGQRELIAAVPSNQQFGCLGLIVDGTIEGIADREAISGRQVAFRLSDQSATTAMAIVAAIRGPALSTELECLE